MTVNVTPLEFLEAVYCDEELPLTVRMRAAIEAAPYKHPKLGVTANVTVDGSFAQMLERAIERSQGPLLLNAPKTIEHEELVTASELKKPFQRNYRRFTSTR
jgi:hypothetical protein